MVKTKGVERSVSNWKSGAAGGAGRYAEGVKATSDWQAATLASSELQKQRAAEAAAKDLFRKGIEKTSNSAWQNAAAVKGMRRWPEGINAAEGDYRKGIGAVLGVIEGVALLPRTSDPDTNIDNRVKPIARALRSASEEGRL